MPNPIGAGFSAAFLQAPIAEVTVPEATPQDAVPVVYDQDLHGNIDGFMLSPEHGVLLRQAGESLDRILDFVMTHDAASHAEVSAGIDVFRGHLLDTRAGNSFQHVRKELYGLGKQALDSIAALLNDERIPLDIRRAEALEIGRVLDVCAPGCAINLNLAASRLQLAAGTLTQAVHRAIRELTRGEVQAFIQATHGHAQNYLGNEIHYYNAYLSLIGPALGIPALADSFANVARISPEDLLHCQERVAEQVTTGAVVLHLAREFRLELVQRLCDRLKCGEQALRDGFELGVASTEALETVQWELSLRYGELEMNGLLEMDGDRARLRPDTTVLCATLVDRLTRNGSVDGEGVCLVLGRALPSEQVPAGFAALATRNIRQFNDRVVWVEELGEVQPARVDDLLYLDAPENRAALVLPASLREALARQAIANDAETALRRIPMRWLETQALCNQLVGRLDDQTVLPYLALALHMPDDVEGHGALHTRLLAALVLTDREALLIELLPRLDPEVAGRLITSGNLHHALERGHARMVGTLCDMLVARALDTPQFSVFASGVLTAREESSPYAPPGLFLAMQNGHGDAVAAYILAFVRLVNMIPHPQRLELLGAAPAGRPDTALGAAMAGGRALAVKGYLAGLNELRLRNVIQEDEYCRLLQPDLGSERPGVNMPLAVAMARGHASAVTEFLGALRLAHRQRVLEGGALYQLFLCAWSPGRPGDDAPLYIRAPTDSRGVHQPAPALRAWLQQVELLADTPHRCRRSCQCWASARERAWRRACEMARTTCFWAMCFTRWYSWGRSCPRKFPSSCKDNATRRPRHSAWPCKTGNGRP